MAPVDAVLSQTLLSLTQSKIRELQKQRDAYEARKAAIITVSEQYSDTRGRAEYLLSCIKKFQPQIFDDAAVRNMVAWLQQARYDSSIPEEMLLGFEKELIRHFERRSAKLAMADLYSRLLTEWVHPHKNKNTDSESGYSEEEEYEVVDERQKQRLQQLCDQFEETVFEPLDTDQDKIFVFLDGLFPGEDGRAALEDLREQIKEETTNQWTTPDPFNEYSLSTCIKGLLTEDLVSEDKRALLKSFLENRVALNEIADVLNFRYADLDQWDWHAGEDGIPVLPRPQLNGKYRIWMDEDVLQTLFVQFIGCQLCNRVKFVLQNFVEHSKLWKWSVGPTMTTTDHLRRTFYLGSQQEIVSQEDRRKNEFVHTYFLCQLPGTLEAWCKSGMGSYDNDNDEESSSEETSKGDKNVKQKILRKIATETLVHQQLYGEAAVIQSDLKWYATCLSHSAIFAVMRYIGFSENWIAFFKKYLESPLNMDQSSEGREPKGSRIRRKGVPMAHASEKLTGELVLFFMDLAVNRETGMLLYRLHDDMWLCGDPEKCARAWEVMHEYAEVTKLEFNHHKTGSVYLSQSPDKSIASRLPEGPVTFGFLKLDSTSGDWVIDQPQVDAHVQQLQTQLNHCDSVISWIRTWNSCIGLFFRNTFGQPAHCFGQSHVHAILATYQKMYDTLFCKTDTPTVTSHLRHMIKTHFPDAPEAPDAFFFMPVELGGLGLRNPFIPMLLVRDNLPDRPAQFVDDFKRIEKEAYVEAANEFAELSERTINGRLQLVNPIRGSSKPPVVRWSEQRTFISFEEWSRFRDSTSIPLRECYMNLSQVPSRCTLGFSDKVLNAADSVRGRVSVAGMEQEARWLLELYAESLLRDFGTLDIVDQKFLPMGVLAMIREKRVKWQMVL